MLCIKLGNVRPTARRRCVAELARVYICEWYARHDGLYRSVFVMAWRRARRMYMHASLYYAWLCGVVYALYAKCVLCVCVCVWCVCARWSEKTRRREGRVRISSLHSCCVCKCYCTRSHIHHRVLGYSRTMFLCVPFSCRMWCD